MTYTLTAQPSNPARGDSVTFTGTFPQAAFRQARNPQFHQNPYLSVSVGDTTGNYLRLMTSFVKGTKNADGTVNGTTYPVLLNSPTWPADTLEDCWAYSGWFMDDKTQGVVWNAVGSLNFKVTP